MNSKTQKQITPSGKCFICEKAAYNQLEKPLQTCEDCKPLCEKYDATIITRAYSDSGKDGARIFVFINRDSNKNQHCLLHVAVSGAIQSPEDLAFKSEVEAINVGKAIVKALLGERVKFEEVTIDSPTDPRKRLQLIAGIRNTSR